MSRNPTKLYEKLQRAMKAWSQLRPGKTYAGFTLESFQATVAPSIELRQQLAANDAHSRKLMALRDDADVLTAKALRRLVSGVKADEDDGEDGELYVEMGYMSRTVRNVAQSVGRRRAREKLTARNEERWSPE
jgi:hypothetical protein